LTEWYCDYRRRLEQFAAQFSALQVRQNNVVVCSFSDIGNAILQITDGWDLRRRNDDGGSAED
jgi:hypothetical protein